MAAVKNQNSLKMGKKQYAFVHQHHDFPDVQMHTLTQ